MEHVSFWYGHKEVFAMFEKGSIPGIPYPEDEGFFEWYIEDDAGYVCDLPKDGYYIHYLSDYDSLVARID